MLTFNNVSKKFGDIWAVKSVDLEIEANKITALLGPNGAGKTTLMRMATGFLSLSNGSIYYGSKKIDTKDPKYKSKIGYLPENNPLYLQMTVAEYLEYVGMLKTGKYTIYDEVRIVSKKVAIETMLAKKIETLSKGYKQRVGIAASIIRNPEVIILDEPTSGLDPNQIIEIRKLIQSLSKEKTILLSTHILPEAKEISSRIIVMNKGEIVLNDETRKIKNIEKKFIELTSQ